METLTLTELKALKHAVTDAYWNTRTNTQAWIDYGTEWLFLRDKLESQIKDLQFEQEQNPLPFPEK